jgi:hypothetical protein
MARVATIAVALTALAMVSEGQTEENRASADYLVPLCRTWLDLAETGREALESMGRTEPVHLAAAGVCVGAVFGVLESMRSIKLACPPKDITDSELLKTVLNEIEKHPERMKEEFVVRVRLSMMKSWPCRRKKGPNRSAVSPKR